MFFNKYPYTDFSQINLDWLMRQIMELIEKAGKVKTVAGVAPDAAGDVPAAQLKATLGAGGSFIVNVSITEISGGEYLIMDQTWNAIQAAIVSGQHVDVLWRQSGTDDWISIGVLLDIAAGDENHTCSVLFAAEGGADFATFYAATGGAYPCTYTPLI